MDENLKRPKKVLQKEIEIFLMVVLIIKKRRLPLLKVNENRIHRI